MSQDFQYPTLPHDGAIPCIRLLTLRQGESSSIECNLKVYPISSCPPFIALSYVWGPQEAEKTIALNEKAFSVRNNLYNALQAILDHRSKAGDIAQTSGVDMDRPETWKYFWIDAICIDQKNIFERNYQVGLMKQIYSNATFVLAWLGDASAEIETGMMEFPANKRLEWRESEVKKMFDLLELLFAKEYWTRIWIIQEIVLAQNVLIMCGSQTLHWGIAISWFTTPHARGFLSEHELFFNRRGYSILSLIKSLVLEDCHQKAFSLEDLLFNTWLQNCSDFRDSIYGLLGLMLPHDSFALRADYSLTKEQLFEKVTKHLARWYPPEDAARLEEWKAVLTLCLPISKSLADAYFYMYMPKLK